MKGDTIQDGVITEADTCPSSLRPG